MIVWKVDLHLPLQSVPITTNVASSNPAQARCTRYNIKILSRLWGKYVIFIELCVKWHRSTKIQFYMCI